MSTHDGMLTPVTGLRWLFVDMNSFFASCEQQTNPDLRGRPVVVAPLLADTTSAIAASYECKAFGVRTGTPIWEAKKLCPQIAVVEARPKLYVEIHRDIIAAIETCAPVAAVLSIDEMACQLDTVQVQPERARALAGSIKRAIRERVGEVLRCSIGIAPNRLLAKLACDMQKPDGLTVLEPKDLPQAILRLKLEDIPGIGPNMLVRLNRAGILDMTQLWAADAARLKRIWGGIVGVRFHAQLHGVDLDAPATLKKSMGHQPVLAPDERTIEKATPIVRQLLVRVALRLRTEGFYCRRLSVDIKWAQDKGHYQDEARFQETRDTPFLLEQLMRLWTLAPQMHAPLRVGVTLSDFAAQDAHQPDLFEAAEQPGNLTSAIDKMNARFGRGTISYGPTGKAMTSKIAFQRVPKLDEF